MALTVGEPGPWFSAPAPGTPSFDIAAMAGRYVLLGFLPADPQARDEAMAALVQNRDLFDDQKISALVIVSQEAGSAKVQDVAGLRWLLDPDGRIGRLYQIFDDQGVQQLSWTLLDPTLRILAFATSAQTQAMIRVLRGLPPVEHHASTPMHPPVLILPRVFEPDFCQRLIALYDAEPATIGRDVAIKDPGMLAALRERLERRLFPELTKAFQFHPSRIERYVVSCYDAVDGGVFHSHRDNADIGAASRRFACSINLNDGFEGGDLLFPEYSRQTFRPPPGGAVIFSCSLIHEVTLLSAGRRYAFLPFIHDEAGHEALEAHRKSLAQPAG